MKKGDLITGTLIGFNYVGKEVKYCRITVAVGDKTYRTILGTAEVFPFSAMLSLKGAGAQASMTYTDDNEYGPVFNDVEFKL